MGDFRDLRAWRSARELAVLSRPAIQKLPSYERFALADQWRRASYSVVLNIAEGASRRGSREFRRYLEIARASLHELEAILDLVGALGYLSVEEVTPLEAVRADCAKMVFGLIRRLDAKPTVRRSDVAS